MTKGALSAFLPSNFWPVLRFQQYDYLHTRIIHSEIIPLIYLPCCISELLRNFHILKFVRTRVCAQQRKWIVMKDLTDIFIAVPDRWTHATICDILEWILWKREISSPTPIIKLVHQVMNTTWDAHMTPHSCGGAAGPNIQRGLKLVKSIWWFTLLVKFHAWQCLKSAANMQPQIWQHLEANLVQEWSWARKSKFPQRLHLMWKWTDLAIVLTFEICRVAMRTRKRGPWIKTRWLH